MDFDPKKNYYEILWVSEDASQEEIKKAFKKLAMQHHPDKKGWDKAKFQEVNEAHQVLGNESKRQQYDMYRKGGGWFGGFWWADFGGFGGGWFDFGDVVGDIFGGWFGWGWRSRVRKWEDIKQTLTITFEEAYLGTKKKIRYHRRVMAEGVTEETCSTCNGNGKVLQQAQTPFGVMQIQTNCPTCGWTGKTYKKDGKTLDGDGLERVTEDVEVNVPTWVKDWVYLKMSGRWNAGFGGGPMGDLYLKVSVKPSDVYERKGDDLYANVSMSIFDLVLWGEVTAPHPEGSFNVKIPKGTQLTDLIKVGNKGFGESWVFKSKGSMYIIPQVHIPKKLSKDQEKLRKQLQVSK